MCKYFFFSFFEVNRNANPKVILLPLLVFKGWSKQSNIAALLWSFGIQRRYLTRDAKRNVEYSPCSLQHVHPWFQFEWRLEAIGIQWKYRNRTSGDTGECSMLSVPLGRKSHFPKWLWYWQAILLPHVRRPRATVKAGKLCQDSIAAEHLFVAFSFVSVSSP